MPAADARAIAHAFLPQRWYGNRWDYYYTLAKLRSDPLYPGVLNALRGSTAPVLDLGCGLGLLGHALRHDGQNQGYRGVDNDAAKISRGQRCMERQGLAQARLEYMDLAREQPQHRGSVAILDVLQYLDQPTQTALLIHAASMLDGDGRLVIRVAIADESRRGRTSRVTDRLAKIIGWMQSTPHTYPTAEHFQQVLAAAGLSVEMTPLYGNTPFNNWLIVAQRR
jgi:cyclopropane fatty-acyl-phospholipid synthase-like methyltransferase